MSGKSTPVLEEALLLTPVERAELAERLLTSLDSSSQSEIDRVWAQEAEERLDAYERGEIKVVSATEVLVRSGAKR
jgi:putative addiction module component (TIGR02574 family)